MSDEEKKAIERLIIYKDKIKDELYPIIDFEEEKAIGVVLNLIEKQSKEIEELKNQEATQRKINELLVQRYSNSISLQKIKDKIEEVKDGTYDAKIVLESLLEDRLNDGITKIPDYDITSVVDAYLKLLNYKKGE